MNLKIFFLISILALNLSFLYAEENKAGEQAVKIPPQKEKLIIFYFQDKSETEEFEYLSSIIPYSILQDINKIGEYKAETSAVTVNYLESSAPDEDRNTFIRRLNELNKEYRAEYMLAGFYSVNKKEKQITIHSQIFDTESNRIIYAEETKSRLSAILMGMIEETTNNVNTALTEIAKLKKEEKEKARKKAEEEKRKNTSPYIGMYNTLSGFIFSMNYGKTDFFREDKYENCDHVSLALSYEFSYLAISAKYDYFSTRTNKSYNSDNRDLELTFSGVALDLSYLVKFAPNFYLAASLGGGIGKVDLLMQEEKDSSGTVTAPAETLEDSLHPYGNAGISMNFYIGNLKLESGFMYNMIHISPTIDYAVLYFGLGYRI